jgi:uncharacterized membrane protein YccC
MLAFLAMILADTIDKWNDNGQRALDFIRNIGFPLLIAGVALIAYAKSKTFGAVILVVILGAIAWIPVNNPGVLGTLSNLIF